MNQEKLLSDLRRWQPIARTQYKTELLGLFGSWARNEATEKSDVDILIDFLPGASLFDWVGLAQELEKEFNHKIDLVPEKNMKPLIWKHIQPELIRL